MKNILKMIIISAALLLTAGASHAQASLISYGGEKVIRVHDFPDTAQFKLKSGKMMDAGYIYKQVNVLMLPVWNYDGRWVGYIGSNKNYVHLKSQKGLHNLAKLVNVTLPKSPKLPFWDAIGGKVTLGILLLMFAFYLKQTRNRTE